MSTTRITLTVDASAKADALKLFKSLGLDASTAVNMFFKSVVRTQGIPFKVSLASEQKPTEDISE